MGILTQIYAHPADRVAARIGPALITYGRLCADIDAMAHWLLGQGLEPGNRVTLHSQVIPLTTYWDWIMHLGAIRAGLVQSTGGMPPAVAATGAIGPYVAAVGSMEKLAPKANPRLKLAFAPQWNLPLAEQIELPETGQKLDGLENQAVRLLSTSGTTGRPKVVVWDAALIEARLKQVREIGDIGPDTVSLTMLGLITTTGFRYPIAVWQMGGIVLLATFGSEKPDLAALVAPSTFLATSPFRMREMLKFVPGDWPGRKARVVELFGGRVPPLLRQEVLARCGSPVRMSYGATEVGRVAAGDTALVERDPGAVGMVEPGITVEIVDNKGQPKPAGERGIVRMKSDFMVHAYAGQRPAAGAQAPFRGGWFYPGDLGIVYKDGLFAITGRTSETINLAGAKFSPPAIEDRIVKLPEVKDVCLVSLPLDANDVLAAAVVVEKGTDVGALREKMLAHLPKQFPFMLIVVSSIPRNAMGRVPRHQVAKALTAEVQKRAAAARAKKVSG